MNLSKNKWKNRWLLLTWRSGVLRYHTMLFQFLWVSLLFCTFSMSHGYVTGFYFHPLIIFAVKIYLFCIFNFFNITLKFSAYQNILIASFFACYSSHPHFHFQMQSGSVGKPNFCKNVLFHRSLPGLSNITPCFCPPLKYHNPGAAPHHFSASPPSTVPKPCHPPPPVYPPVPHEVQFVQKNNPASIPANLCPTRKSKKPV